MKLNCWISLVMICIFALPFMAYGEDIGAGDLVLVANADVPASTIDAASVGKLFLAKQVTIGDKKIEVTTLKDGPVHEAFLKIFIKKTASQFKSTWKKLVFSGKSKMPKAFATEAEMVAYIAKTTGAIGYIHVKTSQDSSIITDKVKVITIK